MKIKIKLVNQLDIYGNKSYSAYDIEGLDYHFYMGSGVVTSDGQKFKATIYELGDTPVYSFWAYSARKAAKGVLENFDLKLGQEFEVSSSDLERV